MLISSFFSSFLDNSYFNFFIDILILIFRECTFKILLDMMKLYICYITFFGFFLGRGGVDSIASLRIYALMNSMQLT